MDQATVNAELRRIVPEQVRFRLTSTQKQEVVDIYNERPGTVAAICQKAAGARSPYNYFVAAVARVVDEISQQPQPRAPRRPHDLVDCADCADSGFVILLRDFGPQALAGDAAPCHCSRGQLKQRRHGIVHYGVEEYDRVVEVTPPVSLPSADGVGEADAG